MRGKRTTMAAVATMLAAVSGAALGARDGKPVDTQATLARAAKAYDAKDCGTVIRLLRPIADAPTPAPQPKLLAIGYDLLVACEMSTDRAADAYADAVRATALPESSDYLWRARLWSEIDGKHYAAAVATVEAMSQGRGAALNSVRSRSLWTLQLALRSAAQDALETRLLKVMADPAYSPDELAADLQGTGEFARVLYARKLLAHGDPDAARTMIADVATLSALMEIVFSPDLAPLLPPPVDLRAAVQHDLVRHRSLLDRHPDSLAAVNTVALDLRRLGQPAEALAVLETARPRIDVAGAFTDRDDQLGWWWDELANAQAAQGDYDGMVASFSHGAAAPEGGRANVSQVINLAGAQLDYGRLDAALKTLAIFDTTQTQASGFGMMQVGGIRGCTYARAGQKDRAAAELAAATTTEQDDPRAVTGLLLCLGDQAGAAASYIRRLGDPRLRVKAMIDLADYDATDPRVPVDPTLAELAAVKTRPDVAAAIVRAGGPFLIHLQRGTVY